MRKVASLPSVADSLVWARLVAASPDGPALDILRTAYLVLRMHGDDDDLDRAMELRAVIREREARSVRFATYVSQLQHRAPSRIGVWIRFLLAMLWLVLLAQIALLIGTVVLDFALGLFGADLFPTWR